MQKTKQRPDRIRFTEADLKWLRSQMKAGNGCIIDLTAFQKGYCWHNAKGDFYTTVTTKRFRTEVPVWALQALPLKHKAVEFAPGLIATIYYVDAEPFMNPCFKNGVMARAFQPKHSAAHVCSENVKALEVWLTAKIRRKGGILTLKEIGDQLTQEVPHYPLLAPFCSPNQDTPYRMLQKVLVSLAEEHAIKNEAGIRYIKYKGVYLEEISKVRKCAL